jgi:hypothetical protein
MADSIDAIRAKVKEGRERTLEAHDGYPCWHDAITGWEAAGALAEAFVEAGHDDPPFSGCGVCDLLADIAEGLKNG